MGNLKLNVARTVSVLAVAAFLTLGITNIAARENELKQTKADVMQLQKQEDKLNLELKETLQDKNVNLDKVKSLEGQIQEKNKQIEEKDKQLQAKAAEKARLASIASVGVSTASAAPVATPAPSGGCQDWMRQAGITDMGNAYTLIMRESGCRVNADNPSSDAYGIPQALPGSKMASHGADWETNPVTQLRWMQDYVMGRYGSWANAVGHSNSVGWY